MPVDEADRPQNNRYNPNQPASTGSSTGSGLESFLSILGQNPQAQMSPSPTQANVYSPQTLGLLQQLQAMAMNPAQANQSPFTQMQYPQSYPSMQQGYPQQGLLSGLINRW